MSHMGKNPYARSPFVFKPKKAPSETDAPRHGRRREIEHRPSVHLRWPEETKARRELFDTWHDIAMQVIHEERLSFRLIALVERFVNWKTGCLWPTNERMAARGGRCDPRTIQREIAAYQRLGLLQVDLGWRQSRAGSWIRTRTIRLAIPEGFSGEIDGDTRGRDEDGVHGDTRGRDGGDNRGRVTFEDTFERGEEADNAA